MIVLLARTALFAIRQARYFPALVRKTAATIATLLSSGILKSGIALLLLLDGRVVFERLAVFYIVCRWRSAVSIARAAVRS